ncbi:rhodanese-related sulfurtransferase [Burkholderiales bacterium JOSHI_001]|nr:rhodanese-related sulfurtransferase [Burkholderiales bacterium JOSHI_001]
MSHPSLIAATELMALQQSGQPLVLLDCSFDLADPGAGEDGYQHGGHIPGACYAHLDNDLSSAKTGLNGRHPLPSREAFAHTAARWGVQPGVQVVAYDGQGGPYAARAWWMLRWLGHADVAVLDGGSAAWRAAGGAWVRERPVPQAAAAAYGGGPAAMPVTLATDLMARLPDLQAGSGLTLLDARAAERFRGEVEPLDPVAGRIPGARNRFFKDNLGADGRFLPAEQLRAAFLALGADTGTVVHQCGSGVTACHNLLAMEVAGLPGSHLYPGSWSEWCADPTRPVARG